jgi:hypothetical protein
MRFLFLMPHQVAQVPNPLCDSGCTLASRAAGRSMAAPRNATFRKIRVIPKPEPEFRRQEAIAGEVFRRLARLRLLRPRVGASVDPVPETRRHNYYRSICAYW